MVASWTIGNSRTISIWMPYLQAYIIKVYDFCTIQCLSDVMRTWMWEVTLIIFAFREITFEEFKRLLNDIAPKYGKDHKMDASKGYDAMVAAISGNGPSLAGTTVSNITLLSTRYWMYIHIDDWYNDLPLSALLCYFCERGSRLVQYSGCLVLWCMYFQRNHVLCFKKY